MGLTSCFSYGPVSPGALRWVWVWGVLLGGWVLLVQWELGNKVGLQHNVWPLDQTDTQACMCAGIGRPPPAFI